MGSYLLWKHQNYGPLFCKSSLMVPLIPNLFDSEVGAHRALEDLLWTHASTMSCFLGMSHLQLRGYDMPAKCAFTKKVALKWTHYDPYYKDFQTEP